MNWEDIKKLFRLLKNTDITEFQYEKDGERIKLKRRSAEDQGEVIRQEVVSSGETQRKVYEQPETSPEEHGLFTVTSPIVGTFYRAPSPESPAFVDIGSEINKGQVLCIIEAMKLMNEIESEIDGVVMRVLVENGQPVEYGEPLFLIDPK